MRKLLYTDSGKSSGLIVSFWKNHHLVIFYLSCSELRLTTTYPQLWERRPGQRESSRYTSSSRKGTHISRGLPSDASIS